MLLYYDCNLGPQQIARSVKEPTGCNFRLEPTGLRYQSASSTINL